MNINVPAWARDHFWEEPPLGSAEFWGFRWPPPCKVGDVLYFRFDKEVVARAIVHSIVPPGQTKCDSTGRFNSTYNVFWMPDTFEDLRGRFEVQPRRKRPESAAPDSLFGDDGKGDKPAKARWA